MLITDKSQLACTRYPGSLHSTKSTYGFNYHLRRGNGCYAVFNNGFTANEEAKIEQIKCNTYGVYDHPLNYENVKGYVSWAKNGNNYQMFLNDTPQKAFEEAQTYFNNLSE